jgi:N-acyl homoserine lactone hydrolase
MKIKEFKFEKNLVKDWKDVFQNPCSVTVESLKTGTVKINRHGTINPEHPDADDIKNDVLCVPIMAHLVHHEIFGNFLLDSGLDELYIHDLHGGIKGTFADEFYLSKDENIKYQLDYRDIKLNTICLSHLHPDHIAGIRELPKNIPIIVGKGEIEQYKAEIYGDFLKDVETIYELDFSKLDKISPLGHTADLFGDGSIWAVSTPGHTVGHMSFLVNGLDGPIFFTMDACFIEDNLKLKIAPSDYTWDVNRAQKSLDMIIEFLDNYPEVRVICGHEVPTSH